jgi:hypothetical protein
MRRLALLLGFALSIVSASAAAQNCDGFVDVLASSPFCPDVTWMKTYGVTKGCDATHFCPTENVSRLQMAAFMHRLGQNPAFVNGGNAFGTPAVLGTTDNNSLTVLVKNQRAMTLQPAVDSSYAGYNPNVIAGQAGNAVSPGVAGATIAGGGGCNPGTGGICSIAAANQVTGAFGTVGGGLGNAAGFDDTVAGGNANAASGGYSTVAGGSNNTAGGLFSIVAGGTSNAASGGTSTVAGGSNNTASGPYSIVAGGYFNTASGSYSFAVGKNATADQDDCFVFANWSTQPGSNYSCQGYKNIAKFGLDHGFSVDYGAAQADGGGTRYVYIGDLNAGNTIAVWNGAVLTDGGAWTNNSDRALKADFTAVDAQAVLAKVAQLPIEEWSYRAEDGQRHLGPVAQDFYAAFGLGADDKHITTVDEGGVALAAIKGLNAKVEEQQREIAELREQVQYTKSLAADLVALKEALAELRRGRETVAAK